MFFIILSFTVQCRGNHLGHDLRRSSKRMNYIQKKAFSADMIDYVKSTKSGKIDAERDALKDYDMLRDEILSLKNDLISKINFLDQKKDHEDTIIEGNPYSSLLKEYEREKLERLLRGNDGTEDEKRKEKEKIEEQRKGQKKGGSKDTEDKRPKVKKLTFDELTEKMKDFDDKYEQLKKRYSTKEKPTYIPKVPKIIPIGNKPTFLTYVEPKQEDFPRYP